MRKKLTTLVLAGFLALAVASPVAAHNSGYVGYGSSGWSNVSWNCAAEDRYGGQQSGGWLLIEHRYWGAWCPSASYEWRRLY